MSFFKKVKEISGDVADKTKRGAIRGKLEIEVRRIEGKIGDEKNAIGHAVFPMLESGTLAVDNDDVIAHMGKIVELNTELAERRREIEALGSEE
jgi:hypothetical protein